MRKPKTPVRRAVKAVTRGDACSPPCVVCLLVRGSNAKKETVPKPVQNDLVKFNDLMDENRRLRRDARLYRKLLRALSAWLKLTGRDLELDLTAAKNIDAALAPRRRKK